MDSANSQNGSAQSSDANVAVCETVDNASLFGYSSGDSTYSLDISSVQIGDNSVWSNIAYGTPIRYNGVFDKNIEIPNDVELSDSPMTTIGGETFITEKQSELIGMWDGSGSVEEFRIKADAMFDGISCDDFIVLAEHALNSIKNTKIFETTGSMSERLFDTISESDLFDKHLTDSALYRHFYSEIARLSSSDNAPLKKFVDTCVEKRKTLLLHK